LAKLMRAMSPRRQKSAPIGQPRRQGSPVCHPQQPADLGAQVQIPVFAFTSARPGTHIHPLEAEFALAFSPNSAILQHQRSNLT
jgi:hypothetical protein